MIKREGAFRTDDANIALNHVLMQSCMYAIFPRVSGGLCPLLYMVLPYVSTDVPLNLTPLRKNNYMFDYGSAGYLESQRLFQVDISELDCY